MDRQSPPNPEGQLVGAQRARHFFAVALITALALGLFELQAILRARAFSSSELLQLVGIQAGIWLGIVGGCAAVAMLTPLSRHRATPILLAPMLFLMAFVMHQVDPYGAAPLQLRLSVLAIGGLGLGGILWFHQRHPLPDILGSAKLWMGVLLIALGCTWATWESTPADLKAAASKLKNAAPNVLLLSIDTCRADRLGSYGDRKLTPYLDKLAANGVVFEDASAPMPITAPSHVAMLTGLHPHESSIIANGIRFPSETPNLARILAKQGYRTGAFVSGLPLADRSLGIADQFHTYDDRFAGIGPRPDRQWNTPFGGLAARVLAKLGHIAFPNLWERPAAFTLANAEAWMEAQEVPFFAFVHLYEPHHPYQPPESFAVEECDEPQLKNGRWYHHPPRARSEFIAKNQNMQYLRSLYDAEVAGVDAEIGRFLEALEASGTLNETLVIVTADHGESLGEHRIYFDHLGAFRVEMQVPLLMRFPGAQHQGKRVAGMTRLIDLPATVLQFIGIDHDLPGANLLPAIESGQSDLKIRFGVSGRRSNDDTFSCYAEDGKYKLVWQAPMWHDQLYIPDRELLFDMTADPLEEHNIVQEEPEGVAPLRAALETWKKLNIHGELKDSIDAELSQQLEELGYGQ